MKHLLTFFTALLLGGLHAYSQGGELHLFGGTSRYQGELNPRPTSTKGFGRAFGIQYRHAIGQSEKIYVKAALSNGLVFGNDSFPGGNVRRNLSFTSYVTDGFAALEYRLIRPDAFPVTPYVFAGVGFFNFNPFVTAIIDDNRQRIFLQPLGTEGQGLPEYPDRKPYNLTQINIPFGGGLLWTIQDKWLIGAEVRLHKTFTDYIDDVSTNYALPAPLLRDRGPLALALAWRGDEFNGRPYPTNEPRRGNPENMDWLYYVGITAGIKLGSGGGGRYQWGKPYGRKRNMGCPKW